MRLKRNKLKRKIYKKICKESMKNAVYGLEDLKPLN